MIGSGGVEYNDKTVIEVLAKTEKAVYYFGSLEIVKAADIFTDAQKASAISVAQ